MYKLVMKLLCRAILFCQHSQRFVLRGAKIVFVDIDPTTMNINADLIEAAITDKNQSHCTGALCWGQL